MADDAPAATRVELDREHATTGLAQLVLTLVELLRDLMERQAIARLDDDSLSDDQIEEMGATLLALDRNMDQLVEAFGLRREDLNLDLGPLGRLM